LSRAHRADPELQPPPFLLQGAVELYRGGRVQRASEGRAEASCRAPRRKVDPAAPMPGPATRGRPSAPLAPRDPLGATPVSMPRRRGVRVLAGPPSPAQRVAMATPWPRASGVACPSPSRPRQETAPASCSTAPKRQTWRPNRGPLGPPIGGGRWCHPVWAVASEDNASTWSIDGARGLPSTGSNGPNDHWRRRRWRKTSNYFCSGRRRRWCHQIDVHGSGCKRPRVNHRHRW
jgi:hypothetical protein